MATRKERERELQRIYRLEHRTELAEDQRRRREAKKSGHRLAGSTGQKRRTIAEMQAIRAGLAEIAEEFQPCTCRQIFYLAVGRGLIAKTEAEYDRVVVKSLTDMRQDGSIDYDWIADETRRILQPQGYDDMASMLEIQQRRYRRNRWDDQECYLGIHVEKGTLQSLFYDVTAKYGVPLYITHGFASITFSHDIAEDVELDEKPAFIYSFTDCDPSGPKISQALEEAIRECAPDIDLTFERVCLTHEQVEEWKLPTRPTKEGCHSRGFEGESCELDAIMPGQLREFVRRHIERHIDQDLFDETLAAEAADKTKLARFIKRMKP